MSNLEFIKQEVKRIREREKCPHCGEDIRDMLLAPWELEAMRETIRGDSNDKIHNGRRRKDGGSINANE